ncbi:MAG: efflux RND transporter periplasmic adaptor subunit [Hyphomonas sp.]|mgnify:FL=1|uniref:efflux RND transporter periplasmic adaptor subunit n=1 Tax=Hyphomonas TaxID=85 RepID=UPI0005500215|nr:efflux RND transporter periplasmic adaptor subunit [Hyphomonas oceanitis]|tara:strand:- start:3470 stop:4669 length:1200 start_codon:yes stop_codon:yes gene_type:complete
MTFHWKPLLLAAASAFILAACNSESPSTEGDADLVVVETKQDDDAEVEGNDVVLSRIAAQAAGIRVATAEVGRMGETLNLPAEVRFDADRIANISPQISGIVRMLYATEGDAIQRGDRLALLASRELAELKSDYVSAAAATELARTTMAREEALWADKITSEADIQAARAAFSTASAALDSAETNLHAVGLSPASTAAAGNSSDYVVTSPITGVITQRTVTLGEAVSSDDTSAGPMFTIADDSVVWVDIAVFKQDLARVDTGANVHLTGDAGEPLAQAQIAFISPVVNQASRTATARVIVDNRDGQLRPGQFIRAQIDLGEGMLVVRVPKDAVQIVNSTPSVFLPTDDGFEPTPVVTGMEQDGLVGILEGLEDGQRYVAEGAFTLKSQLEKDSFGADED